MYIYVANVKTSDTRNIRDDSTCIYIANKNIALINLLGISL